MISTRGRRQQYSHRGVGKTTCIVSVLPALLMPAGRADDSGGCTDESWRQPKLPDVRTGHVFPVNGYPDRPVLIQTISITCPVWRMQQEELARREREETIPSVLIGRGVG